MDFDHQLEEEPDMDTVSRLKLRIEFLASKLKAAVQIYPTGEVDLYPTLEQCTTLKKDVDEYHEYHEYHKARDIQTPVFQYPIPTLQWDLVYHVGLCFGELQHRANPDRGAWDLRVRRLLPGRFVARDLNIRSCYHLQSAEMSNVRYLLGLLIYYLSCYGWPHVDYEMRWTNISTIESYHVLSLQAYWKGELSTAGAVEGPDGAIYVRHVDSFPGMYRGSRLPIFVLYQQGFSSLTSTSARFPETTEESDAVGLQATEYEGQPEYIPPVPLGTSTSEYTATPMLTERFAENEVPSADQHQYDYQADTYTNHIQLPSTSHLEAMVVEPTEALQSSNTTIEMYGFTQMIFPSVPINTLPQGRLPHENRALVAPASMTSPEADSPWSETQGPPPPYALSPGIYQLRLEAATRPSPDVSSPDPETPAPPYALSPGVFLRYGDDF